MKLSLFPLAGLVPALLIIPVHGQAVGAPVLSTPGSATWLSEITSTGTRTIFTITGDTVLDWGQFNLGSGSELVFDFVAGNSVVNMLNGTSTQTIAGNVTSNGSVGFFSPNASLRVTGTVTADNVTLATMDVDPQAFNAGETFTMTAGSGSTLTVSGSVTAITGSVVLAGKTVRVSGSGLIQATDAVRIGGGREITVEKSGFGRRLKETSGEGFVLHLGESRAPRIEIAAGQEINNSGRLDTGSNTRRIFLEVGQNGKILREGAGVMVGRTVIKGEYLKDGIPIDPDVDDVRAAVNSSTVKMPALKRPDGTSVSSSRTMVNDVPMSASADSGRDRKRANTQVASSGKAKPLVQRASFFGMRGGSEKKR
jgi:filamentous hemagglutinin family protein